jgi:hypothetical protein
MVASFSCELRLRAPLPLIGHEILEDIPVLRLAHSANPTDVKPGIVDRFAVVNATRKLGDTIGVAGEFMGSICCWVHGFDHLLGDNCSA